MKRYREGKPYFRDYLNSQLDRRRKERRAVSELQLGKACGVTRSTARRWIEGERVPDELVVLTRMAERLGCPLVELVHNVNADLRSAKKSWETVDGKPKLIRTELHDFMSDFADYIYSKEELSDIERALIHRTRYLRHTVGVAVDMQLLEVLSLQGGPKDGSVDVEFVRALEALNGTGQSPPFGWRLTVARAWREMAIAAQAAFQAGALRSEED